MSAPADQDPQCYLILLNFCVLNVQRCEAAVRAVSVFCAAWDVQPLPGNPGLVPGSPGSTGIGTCRVLLPCLGCCRICC